MDKSYNKIIAVSFVLAAAFVGYVVDVTMKVLTNTWGAFARIANTPVVDHGVPIAAALLFFLYMILTPKVRNWASEVALEISKIVWPPVKDTRALTIVVCIIILLASVMFAIFDVISGQLIEFILDLEI